jgi:catalase-peroxidase
MAMDDEETVALIAGGHSLGKTHGAGPAENVGARAGSGRTGTAGLGWPTHGSGKGADAITSGLEVTWTKTPTRGATTSSRTCSASNGNSPGVRPARSSGSPRMPRRSFPIAFDPSKKHRPTMLTTDLSLRFDPAYEKISRRFLEDFAGVRRCLRARLVQADPPRHGSEVALPGPRSAGKT